MKRGGLELLAMKPLKARKTRSPKAACTVPEAAGQAVDTLRAERIYEAVEALFEANLYAPIVVEGRNDAAALRKLGIIGEVITLHRGRSMNDFCEDMAMIHPKLVLLLDWDDEGERLMKIVGGDLKGHWEEYSYIREALKALCQKDIKDIEGIPKLIRRLKGV